MRKLILKVPFYTGLWSGNQYIELGFKSKEELLYWSGSSCGALCFKMAIDYLNGNNSIRIGSLISVASSVQAYDKELGWKHQGIADLASYYQVNSGLLSNGKFSDLELAIKQNNIPIISISSRFKARSKIRKLLNLRPKGGHLVLITGIKYSEDLLEGFYINSVSNNSEYDFQNRFISLKVLREIFTGRSIILSNSSGFSCYNNLNARKSTKPKL